MTKTDAACWTDWLRAAKRMPPARYSCRPLGGDLIIVTLTPALDNLLAWYFW